MESFNQFDSNNATVREIQNSSGPRYQNENQIGVIAEEREIDI